MNKRQLFFLAAILAIVSLGGLCVWKIKYDRSSVMPTGAGPFSVAPTDVERHADIWDGLGALHEQLRSEGAVPSIESLQTLDIVESTTTYRGATHQEKRVKENGCYRTDHSVIVKTKTVALPSTFAGGDRESCEKELALGPEVRRTFVGVTSDQKEAWFVESSPFPIGDALSGEIGLGTDLLRLNLATKKISRWSPNAGYIQRVEPLTGQVLVYRSSTKERVSGYEIYDVFSGDYVKASSLQIQHSGMDQTKDNEVIYHVAVQTALSKDGRYAAFAYIDTSDSGKLEKPMTLTVWDLETRDVRNYDTGLDKNDVFLIEGWSGDAIKIVWREFDAANGTASAVKEVVLNSGYRTAFELVTGTFTFKVMCDGKLYDETVSCAAAKQLVVVRDERPTGATLVEEKVLATVTTTKDDVVIFKALAVPGLGEGKDIVVDFHTENVGGLGVCMSDRFSAVYDTVSPGSYKALKNYPDYAEGGVWANGVMAFVPGCASGAGYPADSVMIYDLSKDKVITVTETKAVPPGLWDESTGYPFDAGSTSLPYWSDLKWDDRLSAFTINLNLVDGHRIQPYVFNTSGKDITPEGL